MPLIPFIPGALAGALINKANCDTAVGAVGCIPPAPVGGTDWVGFCSKSDLAIALTVEVDEIAAINTCVRLPAEREVTGAVGTITGCRVQDGALLQLIGAASPVVWDDPDNAPPTGIDVDDEVGYKMDDFGSEGCQECGSGCDIYSAILWTCAISIKGCVTALPAGIYAVVVLPSFRLTQPKAMTFGGARADLEDTLDFEIDLYDLRPNSSWYPCVTPDVPGPARGPIFDLGGDELMPDVLGMESSPLAVFLTNIAPPVACDCCGEAGFWSGITDGTDPGTAPVMLPAGFMEAQHGVNTVAALNAALADEQHQAEMSAVAAELEKSAPGKTEAQRKREIADRAAAEKLAQG